MKRRAFLAALAAIPAAALLPDGRYVVDRIGVVRAPRGASKLIGLKFWSASPGPEHLNLVEVLRGDSVLLRYTLHSRSSFYWLPAPGREIVVRAGDELTFRSREPVILHAEWDGSPRMSVTQFPLHGETPRA